MMGRRAIGCETGGENRNVRFRLGRGRVEVEASTSGDLNTKATYKRGEVVSLQHSYPLRLLAPENASTSSCRWIYPMTFGGGLVGGDVIEVDFHVGEGCATLVTSQESTKVYNCKEPGEMSQQNMNYRLHGDSFLAILADPVVCFADANFKQTQRVHMESEGNLVMLDWLTAGRMALKELWHFTSYQSRMEVYVDDELVLRDDQLLQDCPGLTVQQSMRNFQVMGTCVVLGRSLKSLVQHLTKLYSKPYVLGGQVGTDVVCSISPLAVGEGQDPTPGCYLRFMATSTALGFSVVKEISSALKDTLGGDPFSNKY